MWPADFLPWCCRFCSWVLRKDIALPITCVIGTKRQGKGSSAFPFVPSFPKIPFPCAFAPLRIRRPPATQDDAGTLQEQAKTVKEILMAYKRVVLSIVIRFRQSVYVHCFSNGLYAQHRCIHTCVRETNSVLVISFSAINVLTCTLLLIFWAEKQISCGISPDLGTDHYKSDGRRGNPAQAMGEKTHLHWKSPTLCPLTHQFFLWSVPYQVMIPKILQDN